MRRSRWPRSARVLTLLGALSAALGSQARADAFQGQFSYDAKELVVTNLIGAVQIEKSTGSKIEAVVKVNGKDADPKWIKLESDDGSPAKLTVRFPLDEYRKYTYPAMGHSRSTFTSNRSDYNGSHHGRHGERRHDDWLHDLLDLSHGDRIEVSGRSSGNALEVWADVTIRVPASRDVVVQLGCGTASANGVIGDVDLYVKSGAVHAADIKGDLLADTGSGDVDVSGVEGELDIDTGSGSIDAGNVRGAKKVSLDTGSGDVSATQVAADELKVDTGSGSVSLKDVSVQDLQLDTGSGEVDGSDVATNDLDVDTGSGSVEIELVKMGGGRYRIETGSGGVRLDMPRQLSANFDCSTGSGSINADIEGVTLSRHERQEARFKVGGGDAYVRVETGSGSIHLTQGAGTAAR